MVSIAFFNVTAGKEARSCSIPGMSRAIAVETASTFNSGLEKWYSVSGDAAHSETVAVTKPLFTAKRHAWAFVHFATSFRAATTIADDAQPPYLLLSPSNATICFLVAGCTVLAL